jgi:hypothetical protein
MHILVRDKQSGAEEWIQLNIAERLMGIAADEIEWALQEYGECETDDYLALEPE